MIKFEGKKLDPATIRALVSGTLIEGATLGQWWGKQSRDLRESFMREIRTAMQNGESLTQATVRIVGGTVDGDGSGNHEDNETQSERTGRDCDERGVE